MTKGVSLQIRTILAAGVVFVALLMLTSAHSRAQTPRLNGDAISGAPADPTRGTADALARGFVSPPPSARLRCYWWWLNGHVTKESILHDLTEMKAKGYGGVLLIDANGADAEGNDPVPAGPTFGSQEWTTLFLYAVKAAHSLGLEITLTITSGWNLGAPFIQPKDAVKILTWTRTLAGAATTTLQQPPLPLKDGFYERIAVLAYPLRHGPALAGSGGDPRAPRKNLLQKSAAAETGGSTPDSSSIFFDASGTPGDEDAEVNDVQDVTGKVDANGVLHWTPPTPGPWEVLNIGYTSSGARLSPGSGTWQGLSLDPLSPAALDIYWDNELQPLLNAARPYLGTTIKYLTTDSWEMGGMNWTANFREEFRKRRGYDPVRYLPVVAGRILTSRETSDRFLADFRRTVGDLITLHFDHMAERAARLGIGIECESGGPHGEPIDALETFRHSAVPQSEFWAMSKVHRTGDAERYFVKEASSASHIYGKRIVAAEGETSMGNHWSESIGMNLKPSFDMGLTEGLNRLVWHQFASSPAEMGLPGQEYFAGTYLNTKVTWWEQAGAFTSYLNRSQYLMQQGQPVADVLYYYGDEVPNFVRLKRDDPAGVLPGYDYDVTSTDALLHRMVIDEHGIYTPEGIHYRMLVLPPSRIMPLSVLQLVERYLHAGGTVVGLQPLRSQGIVPPSEDLRYQQLAAKLWSGCGSENRSVKVGKGTIFCQSKAQDALHAMRILPDFAASSPAIDFIHRRASAADIYFIRNSKSETVATDVTFRVSNLQAEIFDAVTGRIAPATLFDETNDGRTKMSFSLAPYESLFVVFRHPAAGLHVVRLQRNDQAVVLSADTAVSSVHGRLTLQTSIPGSYEATFSNGTVGRIEVSPVMPRPLASGWTLNFPAGWGAPAHVEVPALKSWTDFDDAGSRYFSGTATYRRSIHIDSKELAPDHQLWLDLGDVREVAQIQINGTSLTPLWKQPYSARIDTFLHPGENVVEVHVTNLWPNRLIGDAQPNVKHRYTWTNIKAFSNSSPLLPSGMLGPVRLVPVYIRPMIAPIAH